MVVGYFSGTDELNEMGKRNLRNTVKTKYNCAGYALGCYSWYLPYENDDDDWYNGNASGYNRDEAAENSARVILNDFPFLKRIDEMDLAILPKYKRVIAFKTGDYDFHFRVRKSGRWFEKMGGRWYIDPIRKKDVFAKTWSDDKYYSKTIYFLDTRY